MANRTIYAKFDKKMIAELPQALFPGRIVSIISAGETKKAVDFLLTQPLLGFDTETRPCFTRGQHYKVSLLQVSTHDICFLFRLNHTGMTPDIIRLLEDETVTKVGLSWHDDILSLQRRQKFKPGTFYDLQKHVGEIGIEDMSLQKLFANIMGQRISKGQRLTNWEAPVLSEKQKGYAATDAWACVVLYEELQKLIKTQDFELIKPEEPEKAEETPTPQDSK